MRDAFAVAHHSDVQVRTDAPDAAIARLAAGQHGVVSRAQLLALGLGRGLIEHRVRRKRLHPVHRGTYSLASGPLSKEARWMAAVLASGPGAVLSHWSAAHLWGIIQGGGPVTHVTAESRARARAGIARHFARLADDEVLERLGIPVTAPARVLLDLAPRIPVSTLRRALEQTERLRLWVGPSIDELLDRYPRRAGTPALRRSAAQPLGVTRSELEARFLHLLSEWGLPAPQTNVAVAWFEVDCAWPEQRVVVELDGFATHGSRFAFERDRRRDRALQAAGWVVVRVTWRQLEDDADLVLADLRALLDAL